jgi:hypothetical protein
MRLVLVVSLGTFLQASASLDQICEAVTGVVGSKCHQESKKCLDNSCCGKVVENGFGEFRKNQRKLTNDLASCVGFLNYIFNARLGVFMSIAQLHFDCSRQTLATFPVPVLASALNILMAIPAKSNVLLPYSQYSNWWNLENRETDVRSRWNLGLCQKYVTLADKQHDWSASVEDLRKDGILVEGEDFYLYAIDAFCQFCSMDLYDLIPLKDETPEILRLLTVYSRAYLVNLAKHTKEEVLQWGNLPFVLTHYIFMAATGRFDSERKAPGRTCSKPTQFVPQELIDFYTLKSN